MILDKTKKFKDIANRDGKEGEVTMTECIINALKITSHPDPRYAKTLKNKIEQGNDLTQADLKVIWDHCKVANIRNDMMWELEDFLFSVKSPIQDI